MRNDFYQHLATQITGLKEQGLYKKERTITSPQQAVIKVGGQEVLNFCANNYLGLADHQALIRAAKEGLDKYGFGMASVRFICGTQTVHQDLEARLSHFFQKQDAILFSSCFDANGGVFEPLLLEEDAIISDELNHASIIDGVRLCKATRFRYKNNDMHDLEKQLKAAKDKRFKMIVTDGVFSMDGIIANLRGICDLADKYEALVMVDDSHAVGFMGERGRGTPEHCGVLGRIDILTGTFGKALGGASGGYIVGKQVVIDWLRNRARPYLFSNSLAPMVAYASIRALELLEGGGRLRQKLRENSEYFREQMTKAGFKLVPGEHPIIPVMLYDAKLASQMSDELLAEGVYVIGFSYPVVPKDKARIRTQMSAAFERHHLDTAIRAFVKIGKKLQIIP